jgi:phosphoenolpyruvate-protein phosphotransferase
MQQYKGIAASPGVAFGPAWIYHHVELQFDRHTVGDTTAELARLETALAQAFEELKALEERARQEIGEEEAAIFEAHQMFLQDPELNEMMRGFIGDKALNAEAAAHDAAEDYATQLEQVEDEYFRARATDVRDVGRRVVRALLGVQDGIDMPRQPVVIVADDLTPSDTVQFKRELMLGIVTSLGGPTSHTAILAKALGIPAVVSVPLKVDKVIAGEMMILDGLVGTVTVNPGAHQMASAREKRDHWLAREEQHRSHAHEPAITTDGHQAEIVANIGGVDDARQALAYGAEGVGLFRTEFLFLDRDTLPSEDEQYAAYRAVVEVMGERPLVVRTLDIGGDKSVPYLGFAEEQNPFLGWRAFRMVSEHPDVFEAQFRALLRAGVGADLRIMVPMIANVEEVKQARGLLERVRDGLRAEGVTQAERVQFGIMVEIPSAALIADRIANLVDFFSIGTNDLTQYTLAVDRTNARVAPLADTFHPAVLLLIQRTIEAAHAKGKWVGLCGEFAGNPLAAPLLLGMGLDEFSMAGTAIPSVKAAIRALDRADCATFTEQALRFGTAAEIRAACEAYMSPVLGG